MINCTYWLTVWTSRILLNVLLSNRLFSYRIKVNINTYTTHAICKICFFVLKKKLHCKEKSHEEEKKILGPALKLNLILCNTNRLSATLSNP